MATEIRMPQMGLTMTEGVIGTWYKQVGDQVNSGETLLNVETDKLVNDIESEAEGVILAIYASAGDTVPVQGLLCVVGQPGEKIPTNEETTDREAGGKASETGQPGATDAVGQNEAGGASKQADSGQAGETRSGGRIKISPLAKKTAVALGVDYEFLAGSGPGGRIEQQDILRHAELIQNQKAAASVASTQKVEGTVSAERRVKLKGMRKVVAERMFKSHSEIPSVTQNMKIDVTELVKLRRQINENREWKFTFNDFVLKAVAKALAANKHLLVSLDGDEIVYHEHVNLGMAVAVLEGLIVPVIRDADQLTLEIISRTAKDLAVRAREGKLGLDEYKGSTFTVSNLGMFDIETFTPIINKPEAAILGVCVIDDELAMAEGAVTVRKKLHISFTFDHRLLDGVIAAQFQLAVKQLLEHPGEIIV
jgi:pyruvate dehydrogenase E2 component (dihydrolipoamide acetyltransferase)